jgi:hypothetical protein
MCPPGYGLILYAPAEMECLGIRRASQRGRAERVPPRKSPFALSPGSPRKAIRHWLAHHSEGRAPHAHMEMFSFHPGMSPLGHLSWANPPRRGGLRTPGRKALRQTQHCPPFGHRPLADPWVAMTSPGLRPGRICGRTECVPPRKSPFALSPGLPPRPS